MRWQRRRQHGQAFLETAVVAGFLVIILLGVIGFGNLWQATVRLETAAREGARAAGTGATNTRVNEVVRQELSKTGDATALEGEVAVGINPADPALRTFNTNVTCEVWWKYPVPIPMFNLIVRDRMLYARKTLPVTVNSSGQPSPGP